MNVQIQKNHTYIIPYTKYLTFRTNSINRKIKKNNLEKYMIKYHPILNLVLITDLTDKNNHTGKSLKN